MRLWCERFFRHKTNPNRNAKRYLESRLGKIGSFRPRCKVIAHSYTSTMPYDFAPRPQTSIFVDPNLGRDVKSINPRMHKSKINYVKSLLIVLLLIHIDAYYPSFNMLTKWCFDSLSKFPQIPNSSDVFTNLFHEFFPQNFQFEQLKEKTNFSLLLNSFFLNLPIKKEIITNIRKIKS